MTMQMKDLEPLVCCYKSDPESVYTWFVESPVRLKAFRASAAAPWILSKR